jgi:hypothetical protein
MQMTAHKRVARPSRDEMMGLIRETNGNISRAAATLGVSRPTAYDWLRQLDLLEYAGVRAKDDPDDTDTPYTPDGVDGLYGGGRKPLNNNESTQKYVKPLPERSATLPPMSSVTERPTRQQDLRLQRSVLVADSRWSWAKHLSVDTKKSVSDIVEEALDLLREKLERGGEGE